eukprot:TRINITY_DN7093_c0_g1_i1.p1 TRINITY_DN7093_c0_g1~~TRINITY_DN7093_c0_g1_i1.p1  ORF type:complete len:209 (+),score=32.91 TRINITY_DN7093_c0_g1_i1:22-627(+)
MDEEVLRVAAVRGPHFKKQNLLDDLSFSCYYHFTRTNQILHLCTLPVAWFGIFTLLHVADPTGFLGLILAVIYPFHLMRLHAVGGCFWAVLLTVALASSYLFLHSVGAECTESGRCGLAYGVALACLSALLLQVLGHVAFEKRLPAFRIYEAVFTTPLFLALCVFFRAGWFRSLRDAINSRAPQWKGSERVERHAKKSSAS